MNRSRFFRLVALVGFISAFLTVNQASAVITHSFGTEYSGSGGVLSGPIVVTLDDGGAAGSVTVTVDTFGLDAALSEYVNSLYLNVDPAINPATLSIGATGPYPWFWRAQLQADSFSADVGGYFDMRVDWAPWPSYQYQHLDADKTSSFILSGAGLEEEHFNFLSTPWGGSGSYVAALRVRGLSGGLEGYFSPTEDYVIPEPASLIVWSLLAGIAVACRRRKV